MNSEESMLSLTLVLFFCHGLPYIKICPYTDAEWETLPKVTWTSDADWDPDVLDGEPPDEETWYDAVSDLADGLLLSPFDEFGRYQHRSVHQHCLADGEMAPATASLQEAVEDASTFHTPHFYFPAAGCQQLQCSLHHTAPKAPNYELLRPFFLHATADTVK